MKVLFASLIGVMVAGNVSFADAKPTRKVSSKGVSHTCYEVNMIEYSNGGPVATLSRGSNVLTVSLTPNTAEAAQLALIHSLQVCIVGNNTSSMTLLSKNSELE